MRAGAIVATFVCVVLLNLSLGASEPAKAAQQGKTPKRFGQVIGLKAEKIAEYKRLHAAAWPEVNQASRDSNISRMDIYLRKLPDGKHYLFMYMEYVGDDFEGDMKRIAANPHVQRWWKLTDACQEPLPDRKPGQWWAEMEEVYHLPN